jgi:hypothetical protein
MIEFMLATAILVGKAQIAPDMHQTRCNMILSTTIKQSQQLLKPTAL